MVVDNVVRTWIDMTVEDHRVAYARLGETVGRSLGVFYADLFMVVSRDVDWIQHPMNVLVGLYWRYGLASNFAKSQTMTCQPGALQSGISAEAKYLKRMGVGDLYCVRLRRPIP